MGKYRTIVIDPPWHYGTTLPGFRGRHGGDVRDRGRSGLPYGTMTLDEIRGLPVADLAARDAHLYLWTTAKYLEAAFSIARAWGFKYSTPLVWCKPPRGFPGFPTYAIATEFVLFCRRGSLKATGRIDRNWWEWKRGAHSQKPEHFIDMVETISPGPYLEMFSRRHRLGWDVWGDGVNSSIDLPLGAA
jgi:N6-adenosine-specific RNA methylase IME4